MNEKEVQVVFPKSLGTWTVDEKETLKDKLFKVLISKRRPRKGHDTGDRFSGRVLKSEERTQSIRENWEVRTFLKGWNG